MGSINTVSGSTGSTVGTTSSTGSHWDSNDHRDNPWGSNVPDTTYTYSLDFGSRQVHSVTIAVDADAVMEFNHSLDWRYSWTDNGDGTYTITYTANDQYNPRISSFNNLVTVKVNDTGSASITVVGYSYV